MTNFSQNLKCILEAFCEIGVLLAIFISFVIFAATFEYIKTLYISKAKPYVKAKAANFKERKSNNRKAKLSLADEEIKIACSENNGVFIHTFDEANYYWQIKPLTIELTDDEIKSFNA